MAPRPTWQRDDCPEWCTATHREDDHPDDRKHVSTVSAVPVIALDPDRAPGTDTARAGEVIVVLHRRCNESQTWLYVGDGWDHAVELSVESWRRVLPPIVRRVTEASDPL